MRRIYLSLLVIFFTAVFLTHVSAEELVISGNGADTQNSVVVNSGSSVVNPQTNSFEAITNVVVRADTGGNSASQNTGDVSITTGDAVVKVSVTNQGNQNISQPQPKATPTSAPSPTSVPTSASPGNPPTSSSQSSSSSSGPSGGSGGVGTAPVLGLSSTSGESNLLSSVITTLGILCLGTALAFIRADLSTFARA